MKPAVLEDVGKRGSPLEQAGREQILARLREAARLAEDGAAEHAGRLREILDDLTDRVDALNLVCRLGDGGDGTPFSLLRSAALAPAGGAPVTEFLLIPFGDVAVERPCAGSNFVFTRQHAESAKRWFDTLGRKLAVDYEHQSFDRFNTRADGLRPAAGWIGALEVRDDGLWATELTWTERATELLRSGEYRYFSPVVFWTDEDHSDVAGLGPVALTNDPAMRGVQALAASRRRNDDTDEADDAAREHETDEDLVPRAELDAAESEVVLLKNELASQEADAFVERGLRLGKILDSTSLDWREDYLRNADVAEQRLARAPALLPPGRVLRLDRRGEVEPLAAGEREFRRRADVYRRWGIGPEDLAAYERAVAGGRVLQGGAPR